MFSNVDAAFNRFAAIVLAFTLIFTYMVMERTSLAAELYDANISMAEQVDRAEEELDECKKLLDIEIGKNAQLSEAIAELENEIDIFKQEHNDCRKPVSYSTNNVLLPSNATEEDLEAGLLYGLKDYAGYFVEAEEEYGINAIFLASVAALESGWCRTDLAINNNNLFGYKNHNGEGFRVFPSKEASIRVVSSHLKTNYLTKGGKYYHGLSVYDVNVDYCEQSDWASKVDSIAKGIVNRINNT